MKKAFITGINGQDGSYLSEYLLDLGYEVHGTVRRNSTSENQSARLKPAFKKNEMSTHYADLSDQGSLERLLEKIQPDEIYNLAAQSHVRVSFDVPQYTVMSNFFERYLTKYSTRVSKPPYFVGIPLVPIMAMLIFFDIILKLLLLKWNPY